MNEFTSHHPGTFCWLDLTTLDTEGAKKFYTGLFGWEIEDIEYAPGAVYTMLKINGKPVAGMSYMYDENQRNQGMPPFWLSYVATSNAAATIAKVTELGGKVLMDAFDVMEEGRMGVLMDPEGAVLGVWEPKKHQGTSFKAIHGSLCWNEHGSHDPSKSVPFLEKLFDWTSENQKMGEMDYTTFYIGEEMAGGLYIMPPDMKDVPSNWIPYFEIANIDSGLSMAESTGGKIIVPKMYVEGIGNFAVLMDPQGAAFGVVQSEPMSK